MISCNKVRWDTFNVARLALCCCCCCCCCLAHSAFASNRLLSRIRCGVKVGYFSLKVLLLFWLLLLVFQRMGKLLILGNSSSLVGKVAAKEVKPFQVHDQHGSGIQLNWPTTTRRSFHVHLHLQSSSPHWANHLCVCVCLSDQSYLHPELRIWR